MKRLKVKQQKKDRKDEYRRSKEKLQRRLDC